MTHEDKETIPIGNYLLERLSQIGVQAGLIVLHFLHDSHLT